MRHLLGQQPGKCRHASAASNEHKTARPLSCRKKRGPCCGSDQKGWNKRRANRLADAGQAIHERAFARE